MAGSFSPKQLQVIQTALDTVLKTRGHDLLDNRDHLATVALHLFERGAKTSDQIAVGLMAEIDRL